MRRWVIGGGAAAVLGFLAACGNPAATPERETAAESAADATSTTSSTAANDDDAPSGSGDDRRSSRRADRDDDSASVADAAPLPAEHESGAPSWASNRRYTAAQAAQRQFERNGRDFGADTREAYIDAAHRFVRSPPAGAQTAERRNGDRLIYDPRGNVFAVVTSDGAPRTMFKPEDGAAYWREQQERIANGGQRANRRGQDE